MLTLELLIRIFENCEKVTTQIKKQFCCSENHIAYAQKFLVNFHYFKNVRSAIQTFGVAIRLPPCHSALVTLLETLAVFGTEV